MKHSEHAQVAKPVDYYTLMGMQAPPFDFAEKACRAWLEGAQVMQAEAAEFVNARAGKDMAALTEWTRCKTPTDALEMQARYASEALADYVAGSQRMWKLMAAGA
jgi:predicted nucleic acid-binding Zn ribbon protein